MSSRCQWNIAPWAHISFFRRAVELLLRKRKMKRKRHWEPNSKHHSHSLIMEELDGRRVSHGTGLQEMNGRVSVGCSVTDPSPAASPLNTLSLDRKNNPNNPDTIRLLHTDTHMFLRTIVSSGSGNSTRSEFFFLLLDSARLLQSELQSDTVKQNILGAFQQSSLGFNA